MELTQHDFDILDLEREWWTRAGSKESQIADRLEMSLTRYYDRLDLLVDSPSARLSDPLLVLRLRRMRDDRRPARRSKRSKIEEHG